MNFFRHSVTSLAKAMRRGAARGRVTRKTPSFSAGQALETRVMLTANLNLLASGIVNFGGSAVDNDLTVSFDGTNYTFSDPSEPINAIGGLAGFDTNADPNIVTFDPTAVGVALTQIRINGNAGDDTYNIDSLRSGAAEGLEIRDDAGDGLGDQININGDLTNLGNVVLLNSDGYSVGGDVTTASRDITFDGGAITLTADADINAGNSNAVSFGNSGVVAIDGAFNLSVTGDLITFTGAVGGTTPVASLTANADTIQLDSTVEATGAVSLSATSSVIVFDDITAGGDITITGDSTVNSAGTVTIESTGGAITTGGIVNAGGTTPNVTLDAAAALQVNGAIGGVGNFVSDAATTAFQDNIVAGDISVTSGGPINAASLQATAGDVDVDGGQAIFSNAGGGSALVSATGTISFDSGIVGAGNSVLMRNATSVEVVGPTTAVDFFDVQQGGGLFTSVEVGPVIANSVLIEATDITLNGDVRALVDDLTLTGNVVAGGPDTTIDIVASGGDTTDNVIISGSIDAAGPGFDLVIFAGPGSVQNLPNPVTTDVGIGQTTPFDNIRLNAGTVLNFDAITANDDVIFQGGNLSLNGPVAGAGRAVFENARPNGVVELFNTNSTATGPNGDMRVDIGDLQNLVPGFAEVIFGGLNTDLVRVIGDNDPATALDLDAIGLNVDLQFIGNNIDILERIDQGDTNALVLEADDTLNFQGQAVGDGDVRIRNRSGTGDLTVTSIIGQPPSGDYNLFIDGKGGGGFDFTNAVEGNIQSMTVLPTTGTVRFNHFTAINSSGDVDINAANVEITGGVFSTAGNVSITGNVSLLGNSTLRIAGGSDLTINGPINANGNNVIVRGIGGAINDVSLGDVTGAGNFFIDSSGASTAQTVNLGDVGANRVKVRANTLNLGGDVAAAANVVQLLTTTTNITDNLSIASSGLANHYVQIVGAINSTGGAWDLAVDSGLGRTSLVGVVSGLDDLTVSSGRSFITHDITVNGNFSWTTNDTGGTADHLQLLSGRTVTAGGDITIDTDDNFIGDVANLIAGGTLTVS